MTLIGETARTRGIGDRLTRLQQPTRDPDALRNPQRMRPHPLAEQADKPELPEAGQL
jgi:hypothetical protein